MRKDHTEIVLILDRSGSMTSLRDETIKMVNSFIEEQKTIKGTANLTLTVFDTAYEILVNGKDLNDVVPLTVDQYCPGGYTALLDATGRTIDELGHRLDKLPDDQKPEHVIVTIITDGEENSSKEYSHDKVKAKIEHQTDKYGWKFLFLGSGIDAQAAASQYAIMDSMSASHDDAGMTLSSSTMRTAYRGIREGTK